jgi:hypothetical protein
VNKKPLEKELIELKNGAVNQQLLPDKTIRTIGYFSNGILTVSPKDFSKTFFIEKFNGAWGISQKLLSESSIKYIVFQIRNKYNSSTIDKYKIAKEDLIRLSIVAKLNPAFEYQHFIRHVDLEKEGTKL